MNADSRSVLFGVSETESWLKGAFAMVDQELEQAEAEGDQYVNRIRAWRLKLAGYSYLDIAEEMGISSGAAHKYVKWAMENLPSAYSSAEEFKHISLEGLDEQYKRLVQMGSYKVALQVRDMQAKLLGAYAPTKVDATVRTQYEIVGVDTDGI